MEIKQKLLKNIFNEHGFSVDKIQAVSTGKFNQTYIGNLENKKEYSKAVLRIAPPADAGFVFYEKNMMAREPEIHKIVKKRTDIPIPEIFVYDDSQEIIDRNYLIMEYIPGTPLSELNVNQKNKDIILKSVGSYLKELHKNCQRETYGYPGEECMQTKYNWLSAFRITNKESILFQMGDEFVILFSFQS